ncbi:hypothetical protein B0T16DRAFT_493816 [Cercophora newfieldiana]|uniref:Uncharacterized protein n=1 Tax=Cercophora newfieldiana TaxID=92897 RepID=A0AA39Y8F1_9PEZI|nr:hypothetical protein B0T16DRAFT_493816 [Cercophora newfieldiana]
MGNIGSRFSFRRRGKQLPRYDPAEFNPVMRIIGAGVTQPLPSRAVVVLLDTQCDSGIWISRRLVEELGLWPSISACLNPPLVSDASGNVVVPCGSINLTWMWQDPPGTRVYTSEFLVLPNIDDVDVLAGRDFIQGLGLVRLERQNFLLLMELNKAQKKRREWGSILS